MSIRSHDAPQANAGAGRGGAAAGGAAPARVSVLIAILTLLLVAVVVAVISAPLRRPRRAEEPAAAERGALEAAREAKYREIRDAELDFRTGKLSREDHELLDSALRAEALEILNSLSALGERPAPQRDARGP